MALRLDCWLAGLLPCSRLASQIRHACTPVRHIAYLFNQYIIECIFSLSLYLPWVWGWMISLEKYFCVRSSVSALTSIAYYVYVYILVYLQHLDRINHVGHGTMHYISCESAYCGANCLSKMELWGSWIWLLWICFHATLMPALSLGVQLWQSCPAWAFSYIAGKFESYWILAGIWSLWSCGSSLGCLESNCLCHGS